MTASGLWQDIGAGENFFTKLLRLIFLLAAAAAFCFLAILPLTWPQQAVLGLLSLLMALAMARSSDSYLVTLTLMMMSIFCTFRYGYWRITQVVQFFRDPASHWGALDAFFIGCLLLAEAYAFLILFLGYFQTIWPLRRAPVSLPENTDEWPHVDVLIPTYNEPLDVVRYSALGALNMDWPADKLHIYILDDGRRKEFERFAFEAGIGYKTRDNNEHAKAGNINTALKTLSSPLVAIFDCDHVPTRSFLQMTVGWFLRDRKLAMLQTPHHFYSPDPFERNLGQFRVIPNEGELFYGVVQDGNDFWNASFFCGSCAVLRRAALDDIGGIAVETITEDAHTSLRLQMNGWGTAYVNIPQAAGLATERLSAHVGQRIRWARGMIQILRTDNPLFAPGLTFPQRLCYFNAMCHFLYAVPRLIFLTAPLIYLLLNHTNIPGYWAAILAYALPHLTLSNVTNSRIQGEHRHSFWNEIYETVLSPVYPAAHHDGADQSQAGQIQRDIQGRRCEEDLLRRQNRAAVPGDAGVQHRGTARCHSAFLHLGPRPSRHGDDERDLVLLQHGDSGRVHGGRAGVEAVADHGTHQRGNPCGGQNAGRKVVWLERQSTCPVVAPASVSRRRWNCRRKRRCGFSFQRRLRRPHCTRTVVSSEGSVLRVRFENLSIAEEEVLTMVLYSRADSWLGWGEARESDNVLVSLGRIFRISMQGLASTFRSLFTDKDKGGPKSTSLSIARTSVIFLLAALLLAGAQSSAGEPGLSRICQARVRSGSGDTNAPVTPGHYQDTFTLNDAGSPQIELHGIDSMHSIYFTLPETHVARTAKIHVYYAFSPSLLPQLSHLKLILNGTLFATIQPTPGQVGGSDSRDAEAEFTIPTDLLVHNNTLTIEFIGHYTMICEDPANTTLWARVHRTTFLDIRGDLLPLADDLKQLPIPFLDPAAIQPLSIPVVFAGTPSYKAIQAAGIVTSYFGMISENRPVRFPVHIGAIPPGNAIVIADSAGKSARGARYARHQRAHRGHAHQSQRSVQQDSDCGRRRRGPGADCSPGRGLAQRHAGRRAGQHRQHQAAGQAGARCSAALGATDQTIALWDYSSSDQLQGDGTAPLNVYFRIPPDIFYADRPNAVLKLVYRYNSIPIGPISSMQVRINNAFLGSTPLIPGQDASRKMETEVPVPVVNLRPFSNSLSFDFTFQLLKKGGCQDTTPINMQGAILRDSFLDLRGYPHYAPLPNLEILPMRGSRLRAMPIWARPLQCCRHAHRAGDRDLRYADGAFWPADGISGLARYSCRPRRAAQRRRDRFSDYWHGGRSARLRQAERHAAGCPAQRANPGARHAGVFRSAASGMVEAASPTSTPNPAT